MNAANPFEAFADTAIPAPVKRRMAAHETRKSARELAAHDEDALLLKLYGRWKREQKDALLAGPHGEQIKGLFAFLRTMDLDAAPDLMGLIVEARWIEKLNRDERHVVFGVISRAVARCREKAGLAPYDDGVIGEPPKALHQIRDMMGVR
jgi:hypothetical protein